MFHQKETSADQAVIIIKPHGPSCMVLGAGGVSGEGSSSWKEEGLLKQGQDPKPSTRSAGGGGGGGGGGDIHMVHHGHAAKSSPRNVNDDTGGKAEIGHGMAVFGVPIAGSKLWAFMVCCLGVGICGVLHDFIQEAVFRTDGFDHGWFMTLCEMLFFVAMARAELQLQGTAQDVGLGGVPWRQYIYLTVVLAITQGTGSVALSYVNMPVKVVMKSCKLIPTMALGILIIRRRYSALEYSAAVMLCIGVSLFILADARVSPNFNPIGIALLGAAVTGDALTVNLQEKILTQLRCSKEQMLLVSNLMASGWVFLLIAFNGELGGAISLMFKQPHIAVMLALQSVSMYLSVSFYLALVQGFGGVAAVIVTSCRKVITITLSFVAFSKPFTVRYIPTGMLVIAGIMLSVIAKRNDRREWTVYSLIALGAVAFIASLAPYMVAK